MNQFLTKLHPSQQELLRTCVNALRHDLIEWFTITKRIADRELNPDPDVDGDPWWRKAYELLHMLEVVSDILHQGTALFDSAKLPDDWGQVFDDIRTPSVFPIAVDDLERFADRQWESTSSDLLEKKRALWDVHEVSEHLFGRAFPCLFGELAEQDTSSLRDDCILFETASEVVHMISHFESDLLNNEGDKEAQEGVG